MRHMEGYDWHPYRGDAAGISIPGDPNVPTTWRWLTWFFRRFIWKKVVILHPMGPHGTRYRIGFRNAWGDAFVLSRMVADQRFAMRLGREGCVFFALDRQDEMEIKLQVIAMTRLDDPRHKDVPLY